MLLLQPCFYIHFSAFFLTYQLLKSMKTNIQSKNRNNLLNNQIKKYKYKQKIESHNMYDEGNFICKH